MLKSIWTLVVSKGAHWQFREITPCKCLCFNWTVPSTRLWLLSIHLFTFTRATILQRNGFCQAGERHFIFILCTFVHNRVCGMDTSWPGQNKPGETCYFNIKKAHKLPPDLHRLQTSREGRRWPTLSSGSVPLSFGILFIIYLVMSNNIYIV